MTTVIIAAAIVAAALVVTAVAQRRKPDAPTSPSYQVPEQVDRNDFAFADQPWLVAVFTSSTCNSCAATLAEAQEIAGGAADTAVLEVEVTKDKALHDRYRIGAVPIIIVADADGVVRTSFLGPPPAGGLHHALADLDIVDPPPPETGTSVQIG